MLNNNDTDISNIGFIKLKQKETQNGCFSMNNNNSICICVIVIDLSPKVSSIRNQLDSHI